MAARMDVRQRHGGGTVSRKTMQEGSVVGRKSRFQSVVMNRRTQNLNSMVLSRKSNVVDRRTRQESLFFDRKSTRDETFWRSLGIETPSISEETSESQSESLSFYELDDMNKVSLSGMELQLKKQKDSLIDESFKAFAGQPCTKEDARSRSIFLKTVNMPNQFLSKTRQDLEKERRMHHNVILKCEKDMGKLMTIGKELLTNTLANQQNEFIKNFQEKLERKEVLLKDLSQRTCELLAKYEEIKAKWTELNFENSEPCQVFVKCNRQKEALMDLLKKKEESLALCRKEMDYLLGKARFESSYQWKIFDSFAERVNQQLNAQHQAYRTHLDLITKALEQEFQDFFESQKDLFGNDFDKMTDHNARFVDFIEFNIATYLSRLEHLRKEEQDISLNIEKSLAAASEKLEKDLHQARLSAFSFQEKRDMSYVSCSLQIPEEELILNIRKRQVNELNNTVSNMKSDLDAKSQQYSSKIQKKVDTIKKLHTRLTELEMNKTVLVKDLHKKFYNMWAMYYNEVSDVFTRILTIDRQLVGQNTNVVLRQPSLASVECLLPPVLRKKTAPTMSDFDNGQYVKKLHYQRHCEPSETRFLRNILRLMPLQTDDLANKKLVQLMEEQPQFIKDTVKVESILNILQVSDMKELRTLTKYFKPFALEIQNTAVLKSRKLPLREEEIKLSPQMFLTAMKNFVEERETKQRARASRNVPRLPVEREIKEFWQHFQGLIPSSHWMVWKALRHCLEHYHFSLKHRKTLQERCRFLRKQNGELRHLLKEHL